MNPTNKIVHTDSVCKIKIELKQEANTKYLKQKKVGQPTLANNKKCAREFKKAGSHPKGTNNLCIYLYLLLTTSYSSHFWF